MTAPLNRLAVRLAPAQPDGDLLTRFAQDRDEAAFAVLVHRHGPTVYGVCRRILGNAADADDAFQAVFLVLVHRADALTGRVTLGDWLYGVAARVAMKARTSFARLRKRERRAAETRPESVADATVDEPSPWLDRELAALPDKFRAPVVLCLLQDRPRGEVAAELGIPEGTLASRLDTARKRLAGRLARHRVAAAFTGLLVPVPAALADATVNRATGGAGVFIHQLANEVTRTMLTKTKWIALVATCVLTAAVGGLALTAGAGDRPVARRNAPVPEKKPEAEPEWMKKFRKVYELKSDQYVKRVAPPDIDERKEFLVADMKRRWGVGEEDMGVRTWLAMGALFLEDDGKAVTYRAMCSTDACDPRQPGVRVKSKMVKLANVIEYVSGLKTPEVVFDEAMRTRDVCMDGDFVIRKDAPLAKLVPDLQKALGECDLDVTLTLNDVEQEVYVVGGKFAITPREWREKDEIDVYADEKVLNKAYSHRDTQPDPAVRTVWHNDPPRQFVRSLGEFLNVRMVCDVELPAQPRFNTYMHERWAKLATAAEVAADHDPEKVLKNVAEQTGLTFKKEKRKVPVLYVSEPKK